MAAKLFPFLGSLFRSFCGDRRGAAAAEFALTLVLLAVPVLNVIDIGIYVYDRTELENAAQIAVQVAWTQCATTGLVPATVNNNCPSLASAMTAAAQTASLGSGVSISSTAEDFCCPGSGTTPLSCQGSVATTSPNACASGENPGDYIFVTVSYSYSPLYSAVSAASYLTTPITHTAWMRIS